jgi:hypothetical protein
MLGLGPVVPSFNLHVASGSPLDVLTGELFTGARVRAANEAESRESPELLPMHYSS